MKCLSFFCVFCAVFFLLVPALPVYAVDESNDDVKDLSNRGEDVIYSTTNIIFNESIKSLEVLKTTGQEASVVMRPWTESVGGAEVKTVFPVAGQTNNEGSASAAFDGTNILFGIEGDFGGESNMISCQLFNPSSGIIGDRLYLGEYGEVPQVSFGGGVYLLSWEQSEEGSRIIGQLVTPEGTASGPAFQISSSIGDAALSDFTKVPFGGGRFLVAWEDYRDASGDPDIYGQLVNPDGTLFGNEIPIAVFDEDDRNVSLAFDGTNFLAVFTAERRTGMYDGEDVFGQFISPSGELIGKNFVIDENDLPSPNPTAVCWDGEKYTVLFHDATGEENVDEQWDIYARFVSSSGETATNRIAIANSSSESELLPSIAFDGTRYLITVTSTEGGGTNVVSRGRFLDKDLSSVTPWFTLSDPAGSEFPVSLAIAAGEQFEAIMTQLDGEEMDFIKTDAVAVDAPETTSSLFTSISILRSLGMEEEGEKVLFEIDVSAPTGKTITVTVPSDPQVEYDLEEDAPDSEEYEYDIYFLPDSAALNTQYPQGDYVLRLYADTNKTVLEETLTVSFSDGENALPFPEVYPELTQPVPNNHHLYADPDQTYEWNAYSGTDGTATHMFLEITGADETDECFSEYETGIDGTCSYAPYLNGETLPEGIHDVELCFYYRQSKQEPDGPLIECANERYSRYILTVVEHYQLTIGNGTGSGFYTNGAAVNITASDAPTGQVFDRWTGATQYIESVTSSSTTLTMPATNIEITATYQTAATTDFTDGFEGPEIESYWEKSMEQNGTITLSDVQVHSGSKSIQFAAVGGGQKYLNLRHVFDTPQHGTATVWVYDSQEYIYFSAGLFSATNEDYGVNISVQDWDHNAYYYNTSMSNWVGGSSSVARVIGWRKFTLRSFENELVLSVDDQEIYRGAGIDPFQVIRLQVFGPGSGTIYFDDFSFVPASTPDADRNGLPDQWEQQYFGETGIDPGSLCSNNMNTILEAYIAGIDPTDQEAQFGITGGNSEEGTLWWNSVSGRVYSVWWTSNLLNSFECLTNNIQWTSGSYTDTVHRAESEGFYKIEVQLQQ